MAYFELNSMNSGKLGLSVGSVSILGVCLLLQSGCSGGPEPSALEYDIKEDSSVSITLTTTDTSDREVSYQISAFPEHGAISGNPPNITYTPPTNYFGIDEFEYVTLRNDGRVSKSAKVKIEIEAVNDAPVAESIQASTEVNTAVMIEPQAIDIDGQVEDYQIITVPRYGTVEFNGAQFRYAPNNSFIGEDVFEYIALDELRLVSANAKVTVRVSSRSSNELTTETDTEENETTTPTPNQPVSATLDHVSSTNVPNNSLPEVEDLDVVLREDSDVQVELRAKDSDGKISRFGITTLPAHGTLTGSGSNRTYTPLKDYNGTDSFAYVAIDDQGGVSSPAVVSITVDSVNDRPIADSASWVTVEDGPGVYVDPRAHDPDGSILSYSIIQAPSHGRVDNIGGGRWLYVPDEDFSGNDSFQWVAIDDEGEQSIGATTTVTVTEQPDPPSIWVRKTQYETKVGAQLNIEVRASDPENDIDRFEISHPPRANGKFIPSTGTLRELDSLRFEATKRGISSYRIEVRDRSGMSAFATFTIEVINSPPVVQLPTPSYDREEGVVNFVLQVYDPDGTIDHFVIQTIDNRRAGSIKVNGITVRDARSFTTDGACETEVGEWCTLNVEYEPDVIDGHSRRIRVYAVDDEGASSPKDFIRIETRSLRVARYVEENDEEDENDVDSLWQPSSPRIPSYTAPETESPPSEDDDDTTPTNPRVPAPPPPVIVEPEDDDEEEDSSDQDSDEVINDRIDQEEIKQVTEPDKEVPRDRR